MCGPRLGETSWELAGWKIGILQQLASSKHDPLRECLHDLGHGRRHRHHTNQALRKEPPTYIDWPNAAQAAGFIVGGVLLKKAGFQVASRAVSGQEEYS
jgi:hypothetical protein